MLCACGVLESMIMKLSFRRATRPPPRTCRTTARNVFRTCSTMSYVNKSTVTTFALASGGSEAAAPAWAPGGGGRGGGACCLVLRAYPPCAGANAGVKRRRWSYLSAWLPSAPAPRRAAALLVLTLGQTSEPARAEVIVGVHENGARSPTGSIEASGPGSRSPEFRRRFPGETVEDELLLRPDGPPPL